MAKKRTKKVTEEVVAQVEETVVEQPVAEEPTVEVEDAPLTKEQIQAIKDNVATIRKDLFSKK